MCTYLGLGPLASRALCQCTARTPQGRACVSGMVVYIYMARNIKVPFDKVQISFALIWLLHALCTIVKDCFYNFFQIKIEANETTIFLHYRLWLICTL